MLLLSLSLRRQHLARETCQPALPPLSGSSFCSDVRSLMYSPERRGKGGRGRRGGPDKSEQGHWSRQSAAWSPGALRQSLLPRLCERAHPQTADWPAAVQPWDYKQE